MSSGGLCLWRHCPCFVCQYNSIIYTRYTTMILRRRLAPILLVAVFLIIIIVTITRNTSSGVAALTVADLQEGAKQAANAITNPSLPKFYNPFSPGAHPPDQEDSSSEGTKWFSDLRWLNPFSSEIVLDESRALLPPLLRRQSIYTYYEPAKDLDVSQAEQKLLLTWRRAWWAKGFKPIVIGRAEAAKHALYPRITRLKLPEKLDSEAARWMAWGFIGGGILSDWLVLPMTDHDDSVLTFLRRGRYDPLLSFKGLDHGLLCGDHARVNAAIQEFLEGAGTGDSSSFMQSLSTNSWQLVDAENAIAYYETETVSSTYSSIAKEFAESQASGLLMLQKLINAHLHITWQSSFPKGIAVLQPHPDTTAALGGFSMRLAWDLKACPSSPMPSSCPPNIPTCEPCAGSGSDLPLSTSSTFLNDSKTFTIATVPHPYTFTIMHYNKETLTIPFLRRNTMRDQWLNATTYELLGSKISGPSRLVLFKEAVASPYAMTHSLWITAERTEAIQRDWLFGFELPRAQSGTSPWSNGAGAGLSTAQLAKQRMLLELSRETMGSIAQEPLVRSVEAWNLADTEAWRFVHAFGVRRRTEREKWEEQESRYASFAGGETKVPRI